MSDLCVFTANADPLLIASGVRVGIMVHSYPTLNHGFVTDKTRKGIAFLESRTEQFALWTDGTDSLILKSEDEIMSRFSGGILIAAENNCWPDAGRYDPPFLNAGGYMGRREDLIAALKIVLPVAMDEDDQRAWTTAYISGLIPGLVIDTERRVFCSMADGVEADSCVAHWNGRIPGRQDYWEETC